MILGPTALAQTTRATETTPLDRLSALTAADMARVNALIQSHMDSPVATIPSLASYLVNAGGKRLRPMITLASAQMLGYEGDHHIRLATVVEFIHTATLLHDDVVDGSDLRRGKKAAARVWGNAASVLVGDFLFARSFNLMVETGSLAVLDILSRTSSVIAEGEVRQLQAIENIATDRAEYMAIIRAKTAALFAAAAEASAVLADASPKRREALATYGMELGLAFQLVDDALDYGGVEGKLGKKPGDDFREGKVTLPMALAYERGSDDEQAFWRGVLENNARSDEDLGRAISLMRRHHALRDTARAAEEHARAAREALDIFTASPMRTAMQDVCDFVVERAF